ncbi:MAG: SEC-C metal-binding domain-containing protein [Turicibacter sp.]|nr:SEC-C metal-binding domain-containing protein [Turicibacter sp.]
MALFDAWKRVAYDAQGQAIKHIWDTYLAKEKDVYKAILSQKLNVIEGTVGEFAERFGLTAVDSAVFMDGIKEAVDNLPKIEEIETDTYIKLEIDFKRLYQQMVEYKAKPLYSLPEWNDIFTEDEQKEFYIAQKRSHTIVKNDKIGRNDPCPCGSGKKYKKCCASK